MRLIILAFVVVSIAGLLGFFLSSNLFQVISPQQNSASQQTQASSTSAANSETGDTTPTYGHFVPSGFKGPTGQPKITGPKSPPPNY